jgi:MFS family permease
MELARFDQGLGGAMMVPVSRLVLLRAVPKSELVAASSWLLMPGLVGQISGPPIGGFMVTYLDWRWIFWLNLPIGLVGIYLVGQFIANEREVHRRPFDRLGFILSGAALVTLLSGLESVSHGTGLRIAGALLLVGVGFGISYVRHASRELHPILDLALLRVSTFRLALIGGSLTRITQGAQPFLLPLMLQLAFGLKASHSGLITFGTSLGTFTMKGLVAPILRRWGYRASLSVLGVVGACCYAVCGLFRPDWPVAAIFTVLVAAGFVMSFQFTAYNTIAYDEIEPRAMSAAASFYTTFQQLTLSLGICVGATALHASMTLGGRETPGFTDFSTALWVVTAVSLCSVFANVRFGQQAGRELSGGT